jgi:hypothetical protein
MAIQIGKYLAITPASLRAALTPRAQHWLIVLLLAALAAGRLAAAQDAQARPRAVEEPTAQALTDRAVIRIPTAVELESWRKTIIHTRRPKKSCFKATYPETEWTEVQCGTPPHLLMPPKRHGVGNSLTQVGDGFDFVPTVTGNISEAEGQFDNTPGVTSEFTVACPSNGITYVCPSSPAFNSATENHYSLQVNTNPLDTDISNSSSACHGGAAGCQEWEQFVYDTQACLGSSTSGSGFIQYWLLGYGGSSCPSPQASAALCASEGVTESGWCPAVGDCVINAASCSHPGAQPITSLSTMKVLGAIAGKLGTDDEMVITVGNSVYTTPGNNYFPDLKTTWNAAEFNVFGDGGADQAVFNANSTLLVRTSVDSGVSTGPGCSDESFTGESNNLTLVNTTSSPATSNLPSLVFTESNVSPLPNPPVGCAAAISLGDTHIHPFPGGEYDFQAYGDFVLADDGPDFQVQTRQSPGPPGYPNTATNTAVAVLMGKTRVAIYLQPMKLVINGATNNLATGKSVVLPAGVQVTRRGTDEYFILDENGNSVEAVLVYTSASQAQALWMQVYVTLGHSPSSNVRGLLGNPRGNPNELVTATGAVLQKPAAYTAPSGAVDFNDLYGAYASGWRVDPAKSLFVEQPKTKIGIPTKPFFATDLSPAAAEHATAVCKAAGVTNPALLDDCILDTTVLKDDVAVRIFTRIAPPKLVIKPLVRAAK